MAALLTFYREQRLQMSQPSPLVPIRRTCVVEDGLYVDPNTGILKGRHIDLDDNTRGHFCPLYYYNRSWRFIGLFNTYNISFRNQTIVLKSFEDIESAWELTKDAYDRVYFLTQKLLLQEICKRLDIPTTQSPKRPISDARRYRAQIQIFDALWKIVVDNKCQDSCT